MSAAHKITKRPTKQNATISKAKFTDKRKAKNNVQTRNEKILIAKVPSRIKNGLKSRRRNRFKPPKIRITIKIQ